MIQYTYAEIKDAAVVYFIRDYLEKHKSKIQLIKLAETNSYDRLRHTLVEPFEYLGDEETEIKNVNYVFRYLHSNLTITNKQDWQNFINNLIDNFCLSFNVQKITDDNHIYYYYLGGLDCEDELMI